MGETRDFPVLDMLVTILEPHTFYSPSGYFTFYGLHLFHIFPADVGVCS